MEGEPRKAAGTVKGWGMFSLPIEECLTGGILFAGIFKETLMVQQ